MLQQLFSTENLFRLGGDEFAIMLTEMEDENMPNEAAEELLKGFAAKVARKFPHTNISVSIGVATDTGTGDFGELFKKADMALYDSKKAKKSAYTIWRE